MRAPRFRAALAWPLSLPRPLVIATLIAGLATVAALTISSATASTAPFSFQPAMGRAMLRCNREGRRRSTTRSTTRSPAPTTAPPTSRALPASVDGTSRSSPTCPPTSRRMTSLTVRRSSANPEPSRRPRHRVRAGVRLGRDDGALERSRRSDEPWDIRLGNYRRPHGRRPDGRNKDVVGRRPPAHSRRAETCGVLGRLAGPHHRSRAGRRLLVFR